MSEPAVRVLYVFGSLDPKTGGPANSAPNMWISAARAGVAAASACTVEDPPAEGEARTLDRLRRAGVEVHPFAVSRGRQLRRWGFSFPLAAWVIGAARRYDIVHVHGAWMASSMIGLAAARLAGARLVLTPHESLTEGDLAKGASRLRHWVKGVVRWLYVRSADLILTASETEARASLRPDDRALDRALYHPLVEDPLALPPPRSFPALGGLRVGFLGRFDPKKNIEHLIEAAASLPDVALEVAGGGDAAYAAELRRLADARGLGGRVRWLGFIPAAELPAFFASIDVLAMPSRFEGFGMVAAEAMSHGVPVIVAEATGIAELVSRYDCGIVIPGGPSSLEAALGALGGDGARLERFSANALEAVRCELSFAGYGRRLAELYRALAVRGAAALSAEAGRHRSAM